MKKCYYCDGKMEHIKYDQYQYTACGLDDVYIHGIDRYRCVECGEEFTDIPRIKQLHRVIGRKVCRKEGRLSGQEIRFLRKEMRARGTEFAKMLGVSPEYVSRIENDKSQVSETLGRLIRSLYIIYVSDELTDNRDTFDEIIKPHQDVLSSGISLTPADWLRKPQSSFSTANI